MRLILLVFTMATKAIAFDQIFAINAGGDAIMDSDGIRYQGRVSNGFNSTWKKNLNLTNIAETDRDIYKMVDRLPSTQPVTKLEYKMPLKSDGFYVLIAKFSYVWVANRCSQKMTLNDKIKLLPSFDVYKLCGGSGKTCDVYMYFCVKDNKLYYQNQWTSIENEEISIEVHREKGFATIAALVLLKGTLGERHYLKNSITEEPLLFDQSKMNPTCSIPNVTTPPPETAPVTCLVDNSSSDGCVQTTIDNNIRAEIKSLQDKHSELDNQFQQSIQKQSAVIVELQVEQASMKLQIVQVNNDLNEIRDLLATIAGSFMIKPR
jgi:Malectin domain